MKLSGRVGKRSTQGGWGGARLLEELDKNALGAGKGAKGSVVKYKKRISQTYDFYLMHYISKYIDINI